MLLNQLADVLKISPAPCCALAASTDNVLDIAGILRNAVAAGLAPELADALQKQAGEFAADPSLAQYFNTIAPQLFSTTLSTDQTSLVPEKIGVLSEPGEYAFLGLLALYAIPSRRAASLISSYISLETSRGIRFMFSLRYSARNCFLSSVIGIDFTPFHKIRF